MTVLITARGPGNTLLCSTIEDSPAERANAHTGPNPTIWTSRRGLAMDATRKQCAKCREVKAASEFNRDQQKSDGLTSRCRVCRSRSGLRPVDRMSAHGECVSGGCDRPRIARGLCTLHYQQIRRTMGEPCVLAGCENPQFAGHEYCNMHWRRKCAGNPQWEVSDRLVGGDEGARFDRWVLFPSGDGCWEWQGAVTLPNRVSSGGYAKFKTCDQRTVLGHRWNYERLVGPIPEGKQLDHLCRNRRRVRPDHLEPVTAQINVHRGVSFSAVNAAKTHCIHGHEFDDANTRVYYWAGRPHRACRKCASGRRVTS